jgi:hypothetical protein
MGEGQAGEGEEYTCLGGMGGDFLGIQNCLFFPFMVLCSHGMSTALSVVMVLECVI